MTLGPRAKAAVRYGALALWGALFAAWALGRFIPDPMPLLGQHADAVVNGERALDAGAPSLMGLTPTGHWIGLRTADQGFGFWLGHIEHWFGGGSPGHLLWLLTTGAWTLTFVLWAVVFAALFRSVLVGALAPVGLYGAVHSLGIADTYWTPGWYMLTALPLLLLIWERWRSLGRWGPVALVAIMFGASLADSMRFAGSVLPVFVAAFIVLLACEKRWRPRLLVGVALFVAYVSVSEVAFGVMRSHRDDVVASSTRYSANIARLGNDHATWHLLYIGLSFSDLPRHGIDRWSDSTAKRYVKRVDPTIPYLSARYDRTLRDRVVEIARDDPGFVFGAFAGKALATLGGTIKLGLAMLCAIPLAALISRRRKMYRRLLALSLAALPLTFLYAIIVVPVDQYTYPFRAVVLMLGAVAVLGLADSALAAAGELLGADARRRARAFLTERRTLVTAGLTLAVFVGGAAVSSASLGARERMMYLASNPGQVTARDLPPKDAPAVRTWTFRGAAPAGWQLIPGVHVQHAPGRPGSNITTATNPTGYELLSPRTDLRPGRYIAYVRAEVLEGGLSIAALDAHANVFAAASKPYWFRQTPDRLAVLPVAFTLHRATPITIILSNYRLDSVSSRWYVDGVAVRRLRDAPPKRAR